jgi:ABC-type nickel/cobalt efflux system permease component RcnA
MKHVLIIVLVCACVWGSLPVAAQNPFVSGKQQEEEKSDPKNLTVPRVLQPVLTTIANWQRALKRELTRLGREIRENPYGSAFWLFLLFSFVYGVVHALGPGHGKTIVVSYFLGRPGKYLHGVLMGNLLTFVHVFSAVSVILIVRLVLNSTGLASFDEVSGNLGRISYGLLIMLGLVLLGRAIYEMRHSHRHNHGEDEEESLKHGLLTAFVTGLIPCPGAALILMFTLSQQILTAGLLAMVCVALGMGMTTTLFAILTIASRKMLLHFMTHHQQLLAVSHIVLAISGAVLITAIGALMLFGQF